MEPAQKWMSSELFFSPEQGILCGAKRSVSPSQYVKVPHVMIVRYQFNYSRSCSMLFPGTFWGWNRFNYSHHESLMPTCSSSCPNIINLFQLAVGFCLKVLYKRWEDWIFIGKLLTSRFAPVALSLEATCSSNIGPKFQKCQEARRTTLPLCLLIDLSFKYATAVLSQFLKTFSSGPVTQGLVRFSNWRQLTS